MELCCVIVIFKIYFKYRYQSLIFPEARRLLKTLRVLIDLNSGQTDIAIGRGHLAAEKSVKVA